ncbi:MAG: cupin domain-containing protein [Chloroflexota bacterium]
MAGFSHKSFDSPDETRTPPKTRVDVVRLEGGTAGRFTFQPGWRWSEAVKPLAGTDSCQSRHVGAVVSGRMHVVHQDGSEGEVGPADAYVIEPGHDAWVVGDEATILFEFQSAEAYAKG